MMTKQSCTSKMDDDEIQLVQVTVRFTCSADLHTPFYVSRIRLFLPRNPISLPNLILLAFNDYSVRKIDYYSQSDKNRLQHLLLRARTNSGIAIIFSLNIMADISLRRRHRSTYPKMKVCMVQI